MKYSSVGRKIWVARYEGPGGSLDAAASMVVDGIAGGTNVYVTGRSGRDYATVKYDALGKELWVARYDGPERREDHTTAVAVEEEGND